MLNFVLRANAASCALFGALFVLFSTSAASLIGNPPVLIVQLVGIVLLANAAILIWSSMRARPERALILFFSIGDGLWVATTALLLIAGIWITTPSGIVLSIIVAAFVGTCGLLQWKFAPQHN